jgi:hypothetical protein
VAARARRSRCTGRPRPRAARRPVVHTADDVRDIAPAALTHRLVVDLDRSLRGATAESAMAAILDAVPAPPLAPVRRVAGSGVRHRTRPRLTAR